MASTYSATTSTPYHSSPLARETSPFKDPRKPPCTPQNTAQLWDEYERRARENAKRRETEFNNATSPFQGSHSQRFSSATVLDIIQSYDPHSSPRVPGPSPVPSATTSPQFNFGFTSSGRNNGNDNHPVTTVAICKTCKGSITSAFGICEKCKKTIVIPSPSGETTPPLSPSCRNFASTNLPKLERRSSTEPSTPISSSPNFKPCRPSSNPLNELPIRLSSLKPPPPLDLKASSSLPCRSRKSSLTDPNEPFLRLQITRKPVPRTNLSSPTTLPSASHSRVSNSTPTVSSLVNISTPPNYASSSRHASATPSELSVLYPYISTSTTSPPSVCCVSYNLQNTTSAWDDWDSEEEEKAGLVGYWRGKKWRGSRGSLGEVSARRDSGAKDDGAKADGKKRRGRFVRAISCGCGEE
ncbi:hypothetical protein CC78DRAFT_610867 [Lojkania enalia]|uniref:Uncharacterized protein n=1 Tax=Lojkania enalia TaxID=147567 RepID=A0A9P4NCM0_9PLEO|nr:hypothetical protein CC78DRAFT_610867 [Didymosphaeria enalia]